jgi:hypothetical protein
VRVSSTRRTRGTRALPPTSWADGRPSLSAALAEKWSQCRATQVALPFTIRDEDEHRAGRALTSFAITVVIVLFITVVVPTIIGLVRNF